MVDVERDGISYTGPGKKTQFGNDNDWERRQALRWLVGVMKCSLNKEKRKHILGSAVKFSISRAILFLLPQSRTAHPASCPLSATRPDRKPKSNSKHLFSILSRPHSIPTPITAVRTKSTESPCPARACVCTCWYRRTQTRACDHTRTHEEPVSSSQATACASPRR